MKIRSFYVLVELENGEFKQVALTTEVLPLLGESLLIFHGGSIKTFPDPIPAIGSYLQPPIAPVVPGEGEAVVIGMDGKTLKQ